MRWDSPISEELYGEWMRFFASLFALERMKFERCLKPKLNVVETELIVFSDASELAYAICAYVRWVLDDTSFIVNLVMAKNRMAPKRKLSIPRLELCAAVIASRLRSCIVKVMDYQFTRVIR